MKGFGEVFSLLGKLKDDEVGEQTIKNITEMLTDAQVKQSWHGQLHRNFDDAFAIMEKYSQRRLEEIGIRFEKRDIPPDSNNPRVLHLYRDRLSHSAHVAELSQYSHFFSFTDEADAISKARTLGSVAGELYYSLIMQTYSKATDRKGPHPRLVLCSSLDNNLKFNAVKNFSTELSNLGWVSFNFWFGGINVSDLGSR